MKDVSVIVPDAADFLKPYVNATPMINRNHPKPFLKPMNAPHFDSAHDFENINLCTGHISTTYLRQDTIQQFRVSNYVPPALEKPLQ